MLVKNEIGNSRKNYTHFWKAQTLFYKLPTGTRYDTNACTSPIQLKKSILLVVCLIITNIYWHVCTFITNSMQISWFFVTQILRDIKFEDSSSAKSVIFTHLEALNLIFMNFCTIWRLKFTKLTKFTFPKMEKTAFFALLESTKLISRKISVIQKSWNFHTVIFNSNLTVHQLNSALCSDV